MQLTQILAIKDDHQRLSAFRAWLANNPIDEATANEWLQNYPSKPKAIELKSLGDVELLDLFVTKLEKRISQLNRAIESNKYLVVLNDRFILSKLIVQSGLVYGYNNGILFETPIKRKQLKFYRKNAILTSIKRNVTLAQILKPNKTIYDIAQSDSDQIISEKIKLFDFNAIEVYIAAWVSSDDLVLGVDLVKVTPFGIFSCRWHLPVEIKNIQWQRSLR